jgi:hypothetical protein
MVRNVYYLSRTVVAAAVGALLWLGGLTWWVATMAAVLAMVFFVWAPRGGRYLTRTGGGAAPLRTDEWTRHVRDVAARNALVVGALGYAVVMLVAVARDDETVSVGALSLFGFVVVLAYVASDWWQRRTR